MVNHQLKRKELRKRASVSAIVTCIIGIGVLSVFLRYYYIGPKCTTMYFHFNIDYRLGVDEIENNIIEEPYYKLLLMFDKHPSWDFTIELQAAMIARIYETPAFADIAILTDKLIDRGQMELLCVLEYSELFYAYPSDVFELNLKYANETLTQHGLINQRSNCILFQEGQFAYGLATLLNSPWASNVDTVLISHQQIVDYQDYDYLGGNFPVYELENPETGKTIKLLQYDYLPRWEAGYMHSWTFLYDGEIVAEKDDAVTEFDVDDNKMSAFEQQLLMLELEGSQFMTCSDWVTHCVEVGAVKKLNYYIPECNWNSIDYNSSKKWMAQNSGSTDDGEVLANNYRCRQIIMATREIYEQYKAQLVDNKTIIENKLEMAEKLWLQATCSDSTGLTPRDYERITAEGNVLIAQNNCSQVLQIIRDEIPELDVSKLQVDLKTKNIFNNTSDFISLITVIDDTLTIADLPINVETIFSQGENQLTPDINVSLVDYNSSDSQVSSETFGLYKLDITFEGSHNWENNSIDYIEVLFEKKSGNVREIVYCPTLLENYTKRMWRYDYMYDPVHIFLPLSNGLIFIPNSYTGDQGIAIVKNVTQRHTSWLWNYYDIRVVETEGLHMDAHHQFYILNGTTIEQAVNFANRINVQPPWIVSNDTSLIQGNEVYDMYLTIANRNSTNFEGVWW